MVSEHLTKTCVQRPAVKILPTGSRQGSRKNSKSSPAFIKTFTWSGALLECQSHDLNLSVRLWKETPETTWAATNMSSPRHRRACAQNGTKPWGKEGDIPSQDGLLGLKRPFTDSYFGSLDGFLKWQLLSKVLGLHVHGRQPSYGRFPLFSKSAFDHMNGI